MQQLAVAIFIRKNQSPTIIKTPSHHFCLGDLWLTLKFRSLVLANLGTVFVTWKSCTACSPGCTEFTQVHGEVGGSSRPEQGQEGVSQCGTPQGSMDADGVPAGPLLLKANLTAAETLFSDFPLCQEIETFLLCFTYLTVCVFSTECCC